MTKIKVPASIVREDTTIYEMLVVRSLHHTADELLSEGCVDVDSYIPRHRMSLFERSVCMLFADYNRYVSLFKDVVKLTGFTHTDASIESSTMNSTIARRLLYVTDSNIDDIRAAFTEIEQYEVTSRLSIRLSGVAAPGREMLMHQDNIHYLGESYINTLRRHIVNDSSPAYNMIVGCSPMEDDLII